jgi:hypothetical protein
MSSLNKWVKPNFSNREKRKKDMKNSLLRVRRGSYSENANM